MEIGNNKKKKRRLLGGLFLIGALLAGVFFGLLRLALRPVGEPGGEAPKMEAAGEARETKYQYEYKGLERLPFLKERGQIQMFQTSFESNLLMGMGYGDFSTVTAQEGAKEGENGEWSFFLALDNEPETELEGIYDGNSGAYTFGFYRNKNSGGEEGAAYRIEGPGEPRGEALAGIDPDAPDGTDPMEGGAGDAPLSLHGEENLTGHFTAEQTGRLREELLAYLTSQNEFRRQITLRSESLAESEGSVSFRCAFDAPRADKKNLTVGFTKEDSRFVFILE